MRPTWATNGDPDSRRGREVWKLMRLPTDRHSWAGASELALGGWPESTEAEEGGSNPAAEARNGCALSISLIVVHPSGTHSGLGPQLILLLHDTVNE